jgi:hypothetical protein
MKVYRSSMKKLNVSKRYMKIEGANTKNGAKRQRSFRLN